MNIFYLDKCPKKAAEYHCDKHVVKMILETAQIISTVYARYGAHEMRMPKPCFHNHPCTLWAGNSRQHLQWLVSLGLELNKQYMIRYGKEHKYFKLFVYFGYQSHFFVPDNGFTQPTLAMPDDCKTFDAVESYRLYYQKHKAHFAKWKTKKPLWFADVSDTIDHGLII